MRRSAALTALLGALTAFAPISTDLFLPTLPALAAAFATTPSRVQLTLSAYFLGFAVGQLVYGPLADRYGRKPPLLGGIIIYVLVSMACAQATSVETMIGLRFVQGLGACAGPVLARAIVRDLFDRDQGARALSMMTLIFGAVPMFAPAIGAQLLNLAGWQSIFFFLAAFGAACLCAVWFGYADTLRPDQRSQINVFMLAARYGELLSDRTYLGYVMSAAFVYAGMFAYITGSPFVFMSLFDLSPEQYSIIFGMNVAGIMVGAATNSRLVGRFGSEHMLRVGIGLAAAAGVMLIVGALVPAGGFAVLLVPLFLFVGSIGLVGANAISGALAAFPHMAGTASALAGTLQYILAALAGSAVSLLHNGTALPMATVIGAVGLGALAVYIVMIARYRPRQPSGGGS
ncbi:MAG: Bcr/CflA family multidrug efflux MFS transporter [Proteobacteria bacterium]|nr:Bcr/CflA family multidrug efflux MFS transporter [Pseudomonadota bacterium]